MKKWLTVSLIILGIVLLPSSLRAPETFGLASAQTPLNPTTDTTNSSVSTVATVYTKPELEVPFNTASRWASGSTNPEARRGSGDESLPGIWWNTKDGPKYFAIQDEQFVSNNPTDTWFVYGWFGPLSAIKEDYNIKYPQWQDRHNGIDFAGREGIDVTSASEGTVIFAGKKIGNTVIVKNGDYQITYGHLQDISVKTGQQIKVGDIVGHLGKTGTTSPHLHFQVDYIDKVTRIAINPVPLIDTNWGKTVVPDAASNDFYAGPDNPALQPNFTW
jgi:murein DD-endopeptidase MepM/ murein hydrolase activator NlpD